MVCPCALFSGTVLVLGITFALDIRKLNIVSAYHCCCLMSPAESLTARPARHAVRSFRHESYQRAPVERTEAPRPMEEITRGNTSEYYRELMEGGDEGGRGRGRRGGACYKL